EFRRPSGACSIALVPQRALHLPRAWAYISLVSRFRGSLPLLRHKCANFGFEALARIGFPPMPLRLKMCLRLPGLATAALLAVTAAPLIALGQDRGLERRVPTSPSELRLSYAPVVQRAAPAVVNVYAAKTVAVRNPLFDDPIFRRFFGIPGGGGEQVQRSLG